MRRRLLARVIVAATLAAAPAPAAAASAATPARVVERVVPVRVRPAIAGVPLVLHGQRYLTDRTGTALVPATRAELARRQALLRRRIAVRPMAIDALTHAHFARWVGATATLVLRRRVRVDLVDPQRRSVDQRIAPAVIVRGTDGSQVTMLTGRRTWLTSVIAVRRRGLGWVSRPVTYAVKDVRAHGTNVVQRGRQHFVPARQDRVAVRVLFFGMRFTVRDALFGGPHGRAVVVRFPDGHTERRALGPEGQVAIRGLPRGRYQVSVEGGGISFAEPVALSQLQEVRLRVISWLDIAVGGALLLSVAIGLALLGRPHFRRPLRAGLAAALGRRRRHA